MGIDGRLAQVRLCRRLFRGDQRETAESVEASKRAVMRVPGHLSGDAAIQLRRVDAFDAAHSAARIAQRVHCRPATSTEGREDSDAGDGNATDHRSSKFEVRIKN